MNRKGKEDGKKCWDDSLQEVGYCMTWVSMLKIDISERLTCCAEFLEDENRRRVAAFGYHAGYAGKTFCEISHSLSMICTSGSFLRFASFRTIYHLPCKWLAILIPFHIRCSNSTT